MTIKGQHSTLMTWSESNIRGNIWHNWKRQNEYKGNKSGVNNWLIKLGQIVGCTIGMRITKQCKHKKRGYDAHINGISSPSRFKKVQLGYKVLIFSMPLWKMTEQASRGISIDNDCIIETLLNVSFHYWSHSEKADIVKVKDQLLN